MDALYDVAISFLSADEPLAVKIHDALCEHLRVFVYFKRQEELAGTDGLESFRQAFLSQSRLVVVLYRDGWGDTRWTRVEEMAIKDRAFNGGWKSLLFVILDDTSTPPSWLPETHIRLHYAHYGDALIGAIKMRAEELGSILKDETAIEKAKRTQSRESARAERNRLLVNEGASAVKTECEGLRHQLDQKIGEIQPYLTTIRLEHGADSREYVLRTERVSLNFYLYETFPVTESRLVVKEFDGPLILPKDRGRRASIPGEEPRAISETKFNFDYHEAHGWCWRPHNKREQLLTTAGLSEHLIKRILELHDEFETGKKVRRRRTRLPGHAEPWS
jgi:hypothetical protein